MAHKKNNTNLTELLLQVRPLLKFDYKYLGEFDSYAVYPSELVFQFFILLLQPPYSANALLPISIFVRHSGLST